MDYAQANNSAALGAGYQGGLSQSNAIKQEPPRTISSAAARIDDLNQRLSKATESLSMISSQIGALTPVTGKSGGISEPASGAVNRLNSSADQAHVAISEIENLIGGIARALG